jgi:hypothetical protein
VRFQFDPDEYLNGFYISPREDEAMSVILFFLPGILYRLPNTVKTILDLGAGPTIYVPVAVRNRAENIYTSDYSKVFLAHVLYGYCLNRLLSH